MIVNVMIYNEHSSTIKKNNSTTRSTFNTYQLFLSLFLVITVDIYVYGYYHALRYTLFLLNSKYRIGRHIDQYNITTY